MVPSASVERSSPKDRSIVFSAAPVRFCISACRKLFRAEFIEKLEVLPSERYIPVVSIVTAIFPLSSCDIVFSSSATIWFSGALMMNCSPMSFSVLLSTTPVSKVHIWLVPS